MNKEEMINNAVDKVNNDNQEKLQERICSLVNGILQYENEIKYRHEHIERLKTDLKELQEPTSFSLDLECKSNSP